MLPVGSDGASKLIHLRTYKESRGTRQESHAYLSRSLLAFRSKA